MLPKAGISCLGGGIVARAGRARRYRSAPCRKTLRGIIRALIPPPMACTQPTSFARLHRAAPAAAPLVRACVLRALHTRRHGVPTAFVSLSGVTAMLSAAVRKA